MQNIRIIEQFETIQGEGYYTGSLSYFIRLAGCNVACNWCDTKYSWNRNEGKEMKIDLLLENINKSKAKQIVITGGEPLMYDLSELTTILRTTNKQVNLETSGVYEPNGTFDWICVSPKPHKKLEENFCLDVANELKVVVSKSQDLLFALKAKEFVNPSCKLYLQPEYSRFTTNSNVIIDFIRKNPDWKISIQTHKILNID